MKARNTPGPRSTTPKPARRRSTNDLLAQRRCADSRYAQKGSPYWRLGHSRVDCITAALPVQSGPEPARITQPRQPVPTVNLFCAKQTLNGRGAQTFPSARGGHDPGAETRIPRLERADRGTNERVHRCPRYCSRGSRGQPPHRDSHGSGNDEGKPRESRRRSAGMTGDRTAGMTKEKRGNDGGEARE